MSDSKGAERVFLDPDFRKLPTSERFCVRCQKTVRSKAIPVSVDWDAMTVWYDPAGSFLLGSDCAKQIGVKR